VAKCHLYTESFPLTLRVDVHVHEVKTMTRAEYEEHLRSIR
jgi:hypothetical protein